MFWLHQHKIAVDLTAQWSQNLLGGGQVVVREILVASNRGTLQSLLDLELIVFGGSIGVRPEMYERVRRALPGLFSRPITIAPSRLGDRAGLIGAAWAAGHALRQNPEPA